VLVGLWAFGLPKIGVEFMPALEEGSVMDMPITVPRVSVTEAADDIKARDAVLRSFPAVESVIGKAGRADTPTDPAPLDMIETVRRIRAAGNLPGAAQPDLDGLAGGLVTRYGSWLARSPALEDIAGLTQAVAQKLAGSGLLKGEPAQALALKESPVQAFLSQT